MENHYETCYEKTLVGHMDGAAAYLLRDNIAPGSDMPTKKGTVSVPYPY